MRRALLSFIIILGLILAGCQPPTSTPEENIQVQPSATETEPDPIPTLTETANPGVTPSITASLPQATQSLSSQLNCGQSFCQAVWQGLLERPIAGNYRNTIALEYPYAGTRDGTLPPHHGVEFPNPSGTPVLAASTGEVVYAGVDDLVLLGPYTGFYGNVVIIKHPGLFEERDVFTLYAHLSSIETEAGENVKQGGKIGEVGASGAADGSHLHFEVRLDENLYDRTVNPVLWFQPLDSVNGEGASTMAGSIGKRNGELLSEFEFTLDRIDPEGKVGERYYLKTYVSYDMNQHPILNENFVFPDIPAGQYRIVFIYGTVAEVFIQIEPGSLGFLDIIVE